MNAELEVVDILLQHCRVLGRTGDRRKQRAASKIEASLRRLRGRLWAVRNRAARQAPVAPQFRESSIHAR